MPLYSYECEECTNTFDMFFPLSKWDEVPCCPDCGGLGKKIITAQIQRDEPVWLNDDVRDALMDREGPHREITTRTDYNRYLKDNGIMPTG